MTEVAVILMAYGEPVLARRRAAVSRGRARREAGLGLGGCRARRALPQNRWALAARRGHRSSARRARAGAGHSGLRRNEALAAANRRGRRIGARWRCDEDHRARARAALLAAFDRRLSRADRRGRRGPRRARPRRELARLCGLCRAAGRPCARHRRLGRLHRALAACHGSWGKAIRTRSSCWRRHASSRSARASTAGRSPFRARARPASRGSARTFSRSSIGCMPTASRACSSPRSASSGPPRDPLGPRHRGEGACGRPRARAGADSSCPTTTRRSCERWPRSWRNGWPSPEEACRGFAHLPRLAAADGDRSEPPVHALHGGRGEGAFRGSRRAGRRPATPGRWRSAPTSTTTCSTPRTRIRRSLRPCATRTGTSCASGRRAAPARTPSTRRIGSSRMSTFVVPSVRPRRPERHDLVPPAAGLDEPRDQPAQVVADPGAGTRERADVDDDSH